VTEYRASKAALFEHQDREIHGIQAAGLHVPVPG
jgi:hypothetical protein